MSTNYQLKREKFYELLDDYAVQNIEVPRDNDNTHS